MISPQRRQAAAGWLIWRLRVRGRGFKREEDEQRPSKSSEWRLEKSVVNLGEGGEKRGSDGHTAWGRVRMDKPELIR